MTRRFDMIASKQAWALKRLFSSFLYGVPPHDGATFTVVPLFPGAVALLGWIPASHCVTNKV